MGCGVRIPKSIPVLPTRLVIFEILKTQGADLLSDEKFAAEIIRELPGTIS
jgi:hypothetical protein